MNESISSITTLLKYISYLVEYSDTILSSVIISENEYSSLRIESELFCKRVSECEIIPPGLKSELIQLKLLKVDEEFSLKTFMKSLFKRNKYKYVSTNSSFENQRRENLLLYRDHMQNIYSLISTKI